MPHETWTHVKEISISQSVHNANTARSIWKSEERENLKKELKKYNNYQGLCCNLYYAWCHESKIKLCEILAIILDGMVTNKIVIICLQVTTKTTARLF